MPNTIYLDPSAGTPAVIEIDGVCYQFSAPSSASPNVTSPDATFSDCPSCLCACDIAVAFTGTGTMVIGCPNCGAGTSTVTVSGTGSDATFSAVTRDPAYICEVDGLGYAWRLTATVGCSDGEWTAMLSVTDGCTTGSLFSGPGTGSLACVSGSLSGTVSASGTDTRGNPVTLTFTFG